MHGNRVQQVLGRNLKYLRETRGMSQAQLSERAGISLNFMSMIEIGRKFPSPENLDALAEALGVRPFHLLFEPDVHKLDDPMLAALFSDGLVEALKEAVQQTVESFTKSDS